MKCFPVCYYHFCEEKGRAAKQDFSTADLERCWLILKPSWTTAFCNFFLYKIVSSFGHFVICVLKAYWIFEWLETNDVKFDLWCLFIFSWLCWLCAWQSRNKEFCLLYICVHAYIYEVCLMMQSCTGQGYFVTGIFLDSCLGNNWKLSLLQQHNGAIWYNYPFHLIFMFCCLNH